MAVFEQSLGIFQIIVQLLIYAAIIVDLVLKKGYARLLFLPVVAGYAVISFFLQDFFIASTLITMWFIFSGVRYFVSKWILLGLLLVMVLLGYSNSFFYLIAIVLYIITLTNFLFSSFKQIRLEGWSA